MATRRSGQLGRLLSWEPVRFVAILLLVHAVGFAPQIFRGRYLSSAEVLFAHEPFSTIEGSPATRPTQNFWFSDAAFHIDPWNDAAVQRLRQGEVPLWNPSQFAGAPLLGNSESAIFYPPSFLRLALPPGAATLPIALIELVVAGLFTALLARRLGLGFAPSALSGIAFSLAPWLHLMLLLPLSHVAALLPVSVFAADVLARSPSLGAAAGLAAAFALQHLGGHPETALHVALFTVAWFAFRLAPALRARASRRAGARSAALFVGAGILGLLVAAVQVAPFLDYLFESAAWRTRSAVARALPTGTQLEARLTTLLLPDLFGNPARGTFWGPFLWGDLVLYAGIGTVVLFVIGVAARGNRGLARFLSIATLVAFGVALRLPSVDAVVNAIPLLGVSNNARFTLLVQFCLALGSGLGLHAIQTADDEGRRRIRRVAIVTVVVVGAATAAGIIATRESVRAHGGLASIAPQLASFAGLLLAACALPFLPRAARRFAPAGALAIVAVDLTLFALPLHPSIDPAGRYPAVPCISFLKEQPGTFRIAGLGSTFLPNLATAYGLEDVRGDDALTPWRYDRLLRRIDPLFGGPARPSRLRFEAVAVEYFQSGDAATLRSIPSEVLRERLEELRDDWLQSGLEPESFLRSRARRPPHRILLGDFSSPILDLLGVRYVIVPRAAALGYGLVEPRFHEVYSREVRIFENARAVPRAFLVGEADVVSSVDDALERLVDPSFDFRARAVLEEAPDPQPRTAGNAEIVDRDAEGIEVETRSDGPSLLVVTDSFVRGVRATVDGAEARVLPADVAFRAIALPAGRHRVSLRYQPRSFAAGGVISAAALLVLLGAAFFARRRDLRPRE